MIGIDCDGREINEGDHVEILTGSHKGHIGPTQEGPPGFIYVQVHGINHKMQRPGEVRVVNSAPQMMMG